VINNKETCYAISWRVPNAHFTSRKAARMELLQKLITATVPYKYHLYLLFLKKESNRYRMAVDYRQLNDNLRPATSLLPNTKNYLESLAKKRIFSTLDTASAFNQLEVDEKTKLLAGFVTLGRRLITHRMPFGAKPSPEIFQEYLDDILVATETSDDHLSLKHVFGRCFLFWNMFFKNFSTLIKIDSEKNDP
jgi:hypothetical protein